jgi:hypothetical protein
MHASLPNDPGPIHNPLTASYNAGHAWNREAETMMPGLLVEYPWIAGARARHIATFAAEAIARSPGTVSTLRTASEFERPVASSVGLA